MPRKQMRGTRTGKATIVPDAAHFFVGIVLLVGRVIPWAATWRTLGTLQTPGVILAAVAIAAPVRPATLAYLATSDRSA